MIFEVTRTGRGLAILAVVAAGSGAMTTSKPQAILPLLAEEFGEGPVGIGLTITARRRRLEPRARRGLHPSFCHVVGAPGATLPGYACRSFGWRGCIAIFAAILWTGPAATSAVTPERSFGSFPTSA